MSSSLNFLTFRQFCQTKTFQVVIIIRFNCGTVLNLTVNWLGKPGRRWRCSSSNFLETLEAPFDSDDFAGRLASDNKQAGIWRIRWIFRLPIAPNETTNQKRSVWRLRFVNSLASIPLWWLAREASSTWLPTASWYFQSTMKGINSRNTRS